MELNYTQRLLIQSLTVLTVHTVLRWVMAGWHPRIHSNNEALADSLLSVALPYSQHRLRLGAAMTGAAGNSTALLARLAIQEGCSAVLRHIALCGRRVEPARALPAVRAMLPD